MHALIAILLIVWTWNAVATMREQRRYSKLIRSRIQPLRPIVEDRPWGDP